MTAYADTSFLLSLYAPDANSAAAVATMTKLRPPLPFTPLQQVELRNATRLRVFRKELTPTERDAALAQLADDLANGILTVTPLPWTEVWREAERLSARYVETTGTRTMDILHIAAARTLGATELLTFDTRQRAVAHAEGLRVKP